MVGIGGLGKSLILCKAQFPHLCNGYNKNTGVVGCGEESVKCGVNHSLIQQTYIQDASDKLGSQGAKTLRHGSSQVGRVICPPMFSVK